MQIQNEDATRIIREQAKLTLSEGFPQVLLPNVVPVMDMTPRFHRRTNIIKDSGTTANSNPTIYTVPAKKILYVTGARLAFVKSADCDCGTGFNLISCPVDGASVTLISLPVLALTQERDSGQITFDNPIKLTAGTAILNNRAASFTTGSMARSATIYGYEVDEI